MHGFDPHLRNLRKNQGGFVNGGTTAALSFEDQRLLRIKQFHQNELGCARNQIRCRF